MNMPVFVRPFATGDITQLLSAHGPIQQLRRYLADRFKPSAPLRVGQQAMIVHPVRIQHLIALFAHSSPPPLPGAQTVTTGLFDDGPLASNRSTAGWRASAGKAPQKCGKTPAIMFDVGGLITWLRDRFPRSTTFHVSAATGIPAASVENWLHRRSQPSVEHFMLLISAFGPALMHACLHRAPPWLEHAAERQIADEIDAEIAALQSRRRGLIVGEGAR